MNALLSRRTLLATAPTVLAAASLSKPARAEMQPLSAINRTTPPKALAPIIFNTLSGTPQPLASYLGRPVVLNFWATWCIPCVTELPELDQLAAQGAFTILAVSADRGGAAAVTRFLATHKLPNLTILLDPGSTGLHQLGVASFPTTLLIDSSGRQRGLLEGPTHWSSAGPTLKSLLS